MFKLCAELLRRICGAGPQGVSLQRARFSRLGLAIAVVIALFIPVSGFGQSWQAGFDFRASSSYVTDPANTTYVTADPYPTSRGDATFGWLSTSGMLSRNRSTSVDPRLAGVEVTPNNAAPLTFEIDVPAPGTYQIALAMGDAGSPQYDAAIQFLDGSMPLFTVSAATINANSFVDASGIARTSAQWPANNVTRYVTLTGTKLMVVVGSNIGRAEYTPVAYLGVTSVDGGSSPDFSISASPTPVSVVQGMAGSSTVTTTGMNGFSADVSLSASGAPAGVTVGFNPATIVAPGSGNSTATFTVSASAAPGTYPIAITGTGGGDTHSTTVNLTVTAAADFSISGTDTSAAQGSTGTSTITTTGLNGFNGAIALSATGAPTGVTVGFNPSSIAAPGSGSSTATFTVGSSVAAGTYPVTLTGTSGGTAHSTTVNLTVTATPDFTISAMPTAVSAAQGGSNSSTVTTTVLNGFNAAVSLSASGAPTGVTVGFEPSSIAAPGSGSSTVTFTVDADAATGTYPITITGMGGGSTHTATVNLTVAPPADFTVSALPTALTVSQGLNGTSTVTTTAMGGFNSVVTLSAAGAPEGVTVGFSPSSIAAPGSGSSTVTFTVAADAATGTYPITITGTSGDTTHNTTVTLTVTAQAAFVAGFDFRASAGYVTDPANTTYVGGDVYPTTRNGFTFGWQSTSGLLTRDRSKSVDPRLAGVEVTPNNAAPLTFEIDVPAPGTYQIALAMGDAGSVQYDAAVQFLDGSTPLFTVSAATINPNSFVDASGVARTAAQWPTANVIRQVTLSGTRLLVAVGSNLGRAEYTPIAYVGVTQLLGNPPPPDFSISASPTAVSVVQGMAGTSTITSTGVNGFNSAVSLSASGAPAGVTVSFNPTSIAAPGSGSSTATFTVSASAAPGTYPITITGTGGGDTHNTTVNLAVTAASDFSISGTDASSAQGSTGTSTITTTGFNGFNGAISLSATGTPTGVTVGFNPSSIAAPGNGSSTATFTVGSSVGAGVYPITITGTSGGTVHSTVVNLTVTATPDFTISAMPTAVSAVQGRSNSSTVTTTVLNAFNAVVSLSATGAPMGVTVGFEPTSIAAPGSGSSTVTFTVDPSAATGTYPITITGTSGATVHSTTVYLTVAAPADFTISASPTDLTVSQGLNGTSTVTTTAINGFNSAVALSATGAPAGVTIGFNPASIAAPGAGSSTVTFTVDADAAAGTYPITLTGTSGDTSHNTTVTLTVTAQVAFVAGFDFRASAGYVTDPANTTYVAGDVYPTTRNGFTFGWQSTSGLLTRDRSKSVDPRLAGVEVTPNNAAPLTFEIDVPAPGTYQIALAMGDSGSVQYDAAIQFLDGSTPLFTVSAATINPNSFVDATGVSRTAAQWPTSSVIRQVTLSGTKLLVAVGSNICRAEYTPIAYVGVTQLLGNPPPPDFSISASPTAVSVVQGMAGTSTITSTPVNGFNSAVSLMASGAPAGVTVSFNPSSIAAPGSGSSTATFTVSASATPGTYPITITGTGLSMTHTATVNLTVTAAPDFSISGTAATAAAGSTGTSTITTTALNGFNSAIALSATGAPTGVTVNFNPASIAAPGSGSSTATFTVASSVATGTYPVTITGTSGGTVHSTLVNLTVTPAADFTISGTAATAAQGSTGTSTITTAGLNGFNSAIALSASGAPTGVTVGFNPTSIAAPGSGSSTATFTVASSVAPGTYPITITGMGGNVTHTTIVNLTVSVTPDFTISALPTSVSAPQGGSNTTTVTTTVVNGFNAAVSLLASGAPTGVTVGFNPASIAAPGSGSSTVTFTVSSSTATGTYPITIIGMGGGMTHTATVNLTVTLPADFSISASSPVSVGQGNSGSSAVTTTAMNGFDASVSLAASGAPAGVTVGFNPASLPAPGSGTSMATFTVDSSTATGTYTITITGTSGSTMHTTTVSLTVTPPPDFTISGTDVSAAQGTMGTSTVTTTTLNGFDSAVTLTSSGAPAGVTVNFNPATIPAPGAGTSTATLSVDVSTPTGTYPITITGAAGGTMHSTTVNLTVTQAISSTFQAGFDFRATAGYVTDPANTTYVVGDSYPTTRAGFTFGWQSNSGLLTRDRSRTGDPRLAGVQVIPNNAAPLTFEIDVPAPGSYTIALAMGDAGSVQYDAQVQFLDGTTPLFSVSAPTIGTNSFVDASGAVLTAAQWTSSNAMKQVTLNGTKLIVSIGSNDGKAEYTPIAYVGVFGAAPRTLQSVSVAPQNQTLYTGNSQQFSATANYSDGSMQDVTGSVQWSSSNTDVLTISSSGLATAQSPGSATVTAQYNSVQGTSVVTVPQPSAGPGWTSLGAATSLLGSGACPPNFYGGDGFTFATDCQNVISAWNSALADTYNNRLIIWGGGHNNYYGNEVYALNLMANPVTLTRLNNPTVPSNFHNGVNSCVESLTNPDGTLAPNDRESFGATAYLANDHTMFVGAGSLSCQSGNWGTGWWTIPIDNLNSTTDWTYVTPTLSGTPTNLSVDGGSGFGNIADFDPVTNLLFYSDDGSLYTYNHATNTSTRVSPPYGFWTSIYLYGRVDPDDRLFVALGCIDSTCSHWGTGAYVADISNPSSVPTAQNWTTATMADPVCREFLTGGTTPLAGEAGGYPGLAWDPVAKTFVGWPNEGNSVYLLTPDKVNQRFTCQKLTFPNGPPNSMHGGPNSTWGTFGRFAYFPALDAFVLVNDAHYPAYVLRLR